MPYFAGVERCRTARSCRTTLNQPLAACVLFLLLKGGLPERPMGADCKSVGYAYSGSNPLPATGISGLTCGQATDLRFLPHALSLVEGEGREALLQVPGECNEPGHPAVTVS